MAQLRQFCKANKKQSQIKISMLKDPNKGLHQK